MGLSAARRSPLKKGKMSMTDQRNVDDRVVASFGAQWAVFDQSGVSEAELRELFDRYFAIFPWEALPPNAEGFDMGCGAGRWARFAAGRVGQLHCIDPSSAIDVARRRLGAFDNVTFERGSLDDNSLLPASQDFGYCLGVLHYVPDAGEAVRSCAALLKTGAPLLFYLYYAFDNRPRWFRWLWRCSEALRGAISRLPNRAKIGVTDLPRAGDLLAARARQQAAGEARRERRRHAAVVLSQPELLHDADGLPGSVRDAGRTALSQSRDRRDDAARRLDEHSLFECSAVLVRGRLQDVMRAAPRVGGAQARSGATAAERRDVPEVTGN